MRAVVTRVSEAAVRIDGEVNGQIGRGYFILLGIGPLDTEAEAMRLAEKIVHLRVFSDAAGKMNLALADVGGSVLIVSQFTLYADLKKRRPGFSRAAKPETAIPLYEKFIACMAAHDVPVECGVFGANMQVSSVNDGPVTLLFDTDEV
ncbi:D-aminoacyl-tRNA deacylase [Selenomonas sp. F0473]|uniref:D-aminoacyl-tRNA deacylase n=1 Tax=Selenomonas sp. F0473 TaxID=999423 RepID=UPI00029E86CE|nr:D-aminoacyl-tRNA deacylase [Selenomonas sp. F0473]EKU71621.1 D-tyrosyl-tRNA(Tyr) deacylase [Selenomonas sp. F0473]